MPARKVVEIDIARQFKELKADLLDSQAGLLVSHQRNRELEGMNERLMSRYILLENQHDNAIAKLKEHGIR